VKADWRMRAFAWRRQRAKLLFCVVPPWIENGQSKTVHVVRRHGLSSIPKVSDDRK
jgi:hypothetical protein